MIVNITMNIPKTLALVALAMQGCVTAVAQVPGPSPIFRFEAGEFWLNLHHFLYVLGRAEAHTKDMSRAAVAGAPADSAGGLRDLNEEERKTWAEAVTAYAKGLSLKDAVFDDPLPAMARSLAEARDAATLSGLEASGSEIEPTARALLERAAPIYRKAWWPKHRAAGQAWQSSIQALVDRDGPAILRFITKAYGMRWPASGYPVHLSAYANWAGAYSTRGNLLVVATNPGAGTRGLDGLETVFHEGMHQWDEQMLALLSGAGREIDRQPPRNLSHALIFFTAGEAVRRAAPEHVPYADAFGVWSRGMLPLKAALQQTWLPYLNGCGTRDEALAALVSMAAKESRR